MKMHRFWLVILTVLYVLLLTIALYYDDTTDSRHLSVYESRHKDLFPLDSTDVVGFAFATLGLMIAAGGGIGGGGILVPIYILVMRFSPKHAIPLSNVTVFGGAVANTLLNWTKRHPNADRPLIDWDLILVMEPLTIAGALIGAFLNKVLPEELLTIALVLLLSFTANTTLRKAFKMYKKETIQLREQGLINDQNESELTKLHRLQEQGEDDEDNQVDAYRDEKAETTAPSKPTATTTPDESDTTPLTKATVPTETPADDEESEDMQEVDVEQASKQQELQAILEEERKTPTKNVNMLVTLFVGVLLINFIKGGGAFRSPIGIRCGSMSFWAANLAMLAWIVSVSFAARKLLIQKFNRKRHCDYEYVEGDIRWDKRATLVYPLICCLAGFFAGMFGIGGGIVKGPLMLAMGVHPAVSSASSACMILFTSFTATTSFMVFGLLVADYAFICLLIGFVATLFGQIGLAYLMKRAQRNSYIAFSIGGVVLLSAFLMTMQSLLMMASHEKHASGGICGASH